MNPHIAKLNQKLDYSFSKNEYELDEAMLEVDDKDYSNSKKAKS